MASFWSKGKLDDHRKATRHEWTWYIPILHVNAICFCKINCLKIKIKKQKQKIQLKFWNNYDPFGIHKRVFGLLFIAIFESGGGWGKKISGKTL